MIWYDEKRGCFDLHEEQLYKTERVEVSVLYNVSASEYSVHGQRGGTEEGLDEDD